jgi:hypothetical protein
LAIGVEMTEAREVTLDREVLRDPRLGSVERFLLGLRSISKESTDRASSSMKAEWSSKLPDISSSDNSLLEWLFCAFRLFRFLCKDGVINSLSNMICKECLTMPMWLAKFRMTLLDFFLLSELMDTLETDGLKKDPDEPELLKVILILNAVVVGIKSIFVKLAFFVCLTEIFCQRQRKIF